MGTQGKAAIIYNRVSTRDQAENGTSLQSQEAGCVAKAQELGFTEWSVTREAYTGTKMHDRKLLMRDLDELKSGRHQALIFYKRDRLSRNLAHRFIIFDECKRHGVQVVSVTEKLGDTPEDHLMESVDAYLSEKEIATTRERTLRGKRQNALNGKIHNFGTELYGYRRNKATAKREIYDPEAEIVREVYCMIVSERIGVTAVATRLNKRGVPSPSAGKYDYSDPDRKPQWHASQIGKMVHNPAYKGETHAWVNHPESEQIHLPDGVTPVVVPPELWDQAQDIVSERQGDFTRNESRPSLLRGFVYCAVCGRRMYHESENTHGRAYIPLFVCSSRRVASMVACGASRVLERNLEVWVWERVSNALRHPEMVAAELERRRATGPDETLTERLKIAKREYTKRHNKQEQLREQWKISDDDLFSLEMLQRMLTELEREKEVFLAAIAEIEGRIADQQQSTFQLERLVEYCTRASQSLDSFGFEDRVMALQALQVRITAHGEDWHADGSIPLQIEGDVFPEFHSRSEQRLQMGGARHGR